MFIRWAQKRHQNRIEEAEDMMLELYKSCKDPSRYDKIGYETFFRTMKITCEAFSKSINENIEKKGIDDKRIREIGKGFSRLGNVFGEISEYVEKRDSNEFTSEEEAILHSLWSIFHACEVYSSFIVDGLYKDTNPCEEEQSELKDKIAVLEYKIDKGDTRNHLIKAGKEYLEMCEKCPYREVF